jgi:predicted nicotinamide N-methyase
MLELGAGAGIPGMTAAILGNDVHISDIESVTPRITKNVKSSLRPTEVARVKVVALDWVDLNEIETAITDVNVVIGADVLFETTWEPLVAAVVHMLTIKPTLELWLANVGRVAVHRFKRRLQAQFTAAHVEEIHCQCVESFGHFVWHIYIPQ